MKQLCVLTDRPRIPGLPFTGWERDFLDKGLLAAGIHPTSVLFASLSSGSDAARTFLNKERPNVVVPMGNRALKFLTGKESIDKWNLSPLPCLPEFHTRKAYPTFHPERINREYSLQVYFRLALKKAVLASRTPDPFPDPGYKFLLNPSLPETLEYLRDVVLPAEVVSVDIETGRGMINTVGFAVSPTDAIAINVLPERLNAGNHYELWSLIREILEDRGKKLLLQNFMYEHAYFSKYGILMTPPHHDTMWAQKFLYPELKMGLDCVGRIFTNRPYWKDDGKNWNNVRDWEKHYGYSCQDTSGTFEGYLGQQADLKARNLSPLFYDYLMKLAPVISEMCSWGIPFSLPERETLREETEAKVIELMRNLPPDLNPRSPKQVKGFFISKGYKLYKVRRAGGKWEDSTDEKSLKKLRLKHPADEDITSLIEVAHLNKKISSYLSFRHDPDCRMRYSLIGVGTETGRWAGKLDPWDKGVNPQTIPKDIKKIFHAAPGHQFLECDLRQAESRFVAYDCMDANLIKMLEDPGQDIHRYVAAEIFQKPESEITYEERQLGKKSGHGANYNMGVFTFQEQCLKDMNLTLNKKEAENVLESYHRLFPGIRTWHKRIAIEVARSRKLSTPIGRERYFYGRMGDDLYREAYAYRPQSTIPDIIGCLILHLAERRKEGKVNLRFLLQCHDSVLLEVPDSSLAAASGICLNVSEWHPEIVLPAGRLIIPTEVKVGPTWGKVQDYE